ncbi:MAG TPA: excinuclease ABC subunit UvrA [Blastocatellia bacterium]|nr:excinuclease ABC subunit UvrA [Blastocatellia bacterium]
MGKVRTMTNRSVQEYIEIRGARENNLKSVSLSIPKRKITIFTGVSGSGKSSIVFDTIANESQRLLSENFSMFLRSFMPRYPQPDADALENLSMVVVVDQKRLGGGSHSTVGTVTDITTILRLLFSRVGKPHIGNAGMFSFNDPAGRCPECEGMGRKIGPVADKMLDMSKSLNEGAILVPMFGKGVYQASGFFDNDKKLSDYTPEEMNLLLYGKDRKFKTQFGGTAFNATYLGVMEKFAQAYIRRDFKTRPERTRKAVEPYLAMGPCLLCHGARLSQAALGCKIGGYNIAQLSSVEVSELVSVIKAIKKDPVAAGILKTVTARLQNIVDIGLGYLSLDRETDTLSGGESARLKLVKHLNGSLVDVAYIFDEPSVGLHPHDVHLLNELLQKLRDKGNTVLVVEHDPDVIKIGDHIVDVGPHAGTHGGEIVFEGSFAELLHADTLTGKYLTRRLPIKESFRSPTGQLPIKHARVNNLRNVNVNIPIGVLTVVTGVAGSGKSSLINEAFLTAHRDAIVVDQSAVGASTRSNPATYTGIMNDVRKAFAAANKVNAALFSFNSKGACENCQGLGVVYVDLTFLESLKLPCEVCEGRRFKDEVLAYKLGGKSISDVLEMTVDQALEFFENKEVRPKLQAMSDVGLGYIRLGQPLSTLSAGECQRIKLASELHKKGNIYVMDEPTTGLHMSDITHLLAIMDRLVEGGNSVIVIEHNLDVIRNADWIIDLGPEGGSKGGEVVFEGTPMELVKNKQSLTGQYLRR